MRIAPIVKKELSSYFNSPIAYIVLAGYLVFTTVAFFFLNQFFVHDEASLRLYFSTVPTVFIFLIPALTMRSWAEEKKSGTLELLLTLPFKEHEVVIGKFIGASALILVMMVLSLPLPLSLSPLGRFDAGQVMSQYIGTLFLGACGVSLGLLISSISLNQISAYIFCGIALFGLTWVDKLGQIMNLPRWLSSVIGWISFSPHFDSFNKGILDSRDIAFYAVLSALFLFANAQVLVRRKWS